MTPTEAEDVELRPHITSIEVTGFGAISLSAGAVVFVVGPNNGGKSTFLNELSARLGRVSDTKWVEKLTWHLGTNEEWETYVARLFKPDPKDPMYLRELSTGRQVMPKNVTGFYQSQITSHASFLVRSLDAQNRIGLANEADGPDVIEQVRSHPYHEFFFSLDAEEAFSEKVKAAFGRDFRINRTGKRVCGHLGAAPVGERLATEYEQSILTDMVPVHRFGDGVKSYTGILLNSVADARPITIIDEPEAFLHPPQARRLGHEMAHAAMESGRQFFIATHSSDFIQGALSAKNPNTVFLYLDHSNTSSKIHTVPTEVVNDFSKKPFLVHTNALDALFYEQVIVCEGEADIMFFKWALDGTSAGQRLQESFWISSYGKSAIPGIMEDMWKLGVKAKAIFDLDVLLSPEILARICPLVGLDFSKFEGTLSQLSKSIKVPPAASALQEIEETIAGLSETEDEPSRLAAVRAIKRSAEGLGKSWALKSAGTSALPRGSANVAVMELIRELRARGIVILEEGEIENYLPGIGKHGQAWVRTALDEGALPDAARATIERQLTEGLVGST